MNNPLPFDAPVRRTPFVIVGLVILTAWVLLAAWQQSAYAGLLGHESLGDHHLAFPVKLSAFVLSWLLMTVAMMLPVSLPSLIYSGQSARRSHFLAPKILGYLLPWVLVGLLVFLADTVLHELAEAGGHWAGLSAWVAPATAAAAGLYQFTAAKRRFVGQCRPDHAAHSRVEPGGLVRSVGQGARLGAACVGSCGPLMLLMFAVGHHQPGWMLVLGLVLAGERFAPWGRQLTRLVGALLLIAVFVWLFTGYFDIFGHIHL